MALMPDPGLVSSHRPKVRLAVVVDLGGEAEKASVGVGVGFFGAGGQTVLLLGALQRVQGSVLQVGGLLHNLSIEDQVWGRWAGKIIKGQIEISHGFSLIGNKYNTFYKKYINVPTIK